MRSTAHHLWAMTATAGRTDGLWHLVPWCVGKCAYTVKSDEVPFVEFLFTETPDYPVWYGTNAKDSKGKKIKGKKDPWAYNRPRGRAIWAHMDNYLAEYPARNEQLTRRIQQAVEGGRKVILLTTRRSQLNKVYFMLTGGFAPWWTTKVGRINSNTPMERRIKMGKGCNILLATMGCLKKGADFPRFDTLVLGTPFSSPVTAEQTAGRILSRNNPDKQDPLVIVPYDRQVEPAAKCVGKFADHVKRLGWKFER